MTEKDPQQLRDALDSAAEAIRTANHLTQPVNGAPGLEYPGDVYSAIGNLAILAQRMPQLLRQLSLWLGEQHAAGKVGHDARKDPGPCVAGVRSLLDDAETFAEELAVILGRAQSECSHLKAAEK